VEEGVPVAFVGKSSRDSDRFADATLVNEPSELLVGMCELMARSVKTLAMRKTQYGLPPAYKLPRI
jgi:hypothetical protein